MRSPQPADPAGFLAPDGENIASVLFRVFRQDQLARERINDYMHAILPDLVEVEALEFGGSKALTLRLRGKGGGSTSVFDAAQMSDGTLRALGVLAAIFQRAPDSGRPLLLIGFEEPETALHPAATAVLRDALTDAAEQSQVIVTTQSADLLDNWSISDSSLLAVESRQGVSHIGPLSEADRSILPAERLVVRQANSGEWSPVRQRVAGRYRVRGLGLRQAPGRWDRDG